MVQRNLKKMRNFDDGQSTCPNKRRRETELLINNNSFLLYIFVHKLIRRNRIEIVYKHMIYIIEGTYAYCNAGICVDIFLLISSIK